MINFSQPIVTAILTFVTIGAYALSRVASKKWPSPFTTPAFSSTVIVIAALFFGDYSMADYKDAKSIITFLMGPAVVALAVPLYKNRKIFIDNVASVVVGIFAGSVTTLIAVFSIAKAFGLSQLVLSSMATKSVTAPIAIEVALIIHADPSLAAVFVVMTGILGAMVGPFILTKIQVTDPLARGISLGTISHGIGVAQAVTEGELQGASAGIAMGLTAVLVPVLAPLMLKVFI